MAADRRREVVDFTTYIASVRVSIFENVIVIL
jgi:hypothetical protein